MPRVSIISGPAAEPISVATVKAHLRIEYSEDDAVLGEMIASARSWCETYLRRALLTQTWEVRCRQFPTAIIDQDGDVRSARMAGSSGINAVSGALSRNLLGYPIVLPGGNVQSIVSVTYVDDQGATVTMPSSDYAIDGNADLHDMAMLVPAYGKSWPTARAVPDAVRVRYVVGWPSAAAIPQEILRALRLHVGGQWADREPSPILGRQSHGWQQQLEVELHPYRMIGSA